MRGTPPSANWRKEKEGERKKREELQEKRSRRKNELKEAERGTRLVAGGGEKGKNRKLVKRNLRTVPGKEKRVEGQKRPGLGKKKRCGTVQDPVEGWRTAFP